MKRKGFLGRATGVTYPPWNEQRFNVAVAGLEAAPIGSICMEIRLLRCKAREERAVSMAAQIPRIECFSVPWIRRFIVPSLRLVNGRRCNPEASASL